MAPAYRISSGNADIDVSSQETELNECENSNLNNRFFF
jgi:hypothetical protein